MEDSNNIAIWNVIKDDLIMIINNDTATSQTMSLFDYSNLPSSGGGMITATIQLVNMNYSQFVSGLNMLGGYYFENLSIYATNSAQAIAPFTITKFTDLFGESFTEQVCPILNPFAHQPSCENVRLFFPADGNNKITYTIGANQQVILKITAKAYDVLNGFDNETHHLEPYLVGDGTKVIGNTLPPYYHDTLNKDYQLKQL